MSSGEASAATSGDHAASSPMSIGEVLAHLRAEFPDTTISKLRFLEAEGLVEPRRTPAGYRTYGWDDVARLRFVLATQRDQYLPLRVIREQLAAPDAGMASGARRALVAVHPTARVPGPDHRLTRADPVALSGIDEDSLEERERLGMVAERPGGWYDGDALAVAAAAAGLAAYGVQVRRLRRTGSPRTARSGSSPSRSARWPASTTRPRGPVRPRRRAS